MDRSLKIAIASLGVSIVVLAVKYLAYYLTGSVALYSDALESIINVATAVGAVIAIRIAAAPPDSEHPYGHSKAEYLAAVVVGALIIVAALAILQEAYHAFFTPKPIEAPAQGLLVSAIATALNLVWSWFLVRQGRAHRSAALVADGKHLFADVVTSIGVIVGVGAVVLTGILQLDSIIAALVALNVLWSGWGVLRESTSSLMDEAAPDAELEQIRQIISSNAEGALEAHALRTRHAGRITFVDFHLVVSGSMSTEAAHDICDRIEDALKAAIPGLNVTIHVEPERKAKHTGVPVLKI
ncbi:cation transporter [Escherichia coli]|nr:cation transporter [Escherichia coli]